MDARLRRILYGFSPVAGVPMAALPTPRDDAAASPEGAAASPEGAAASPEGAAASPDSTSRFKFQKLLHPFTVNRGIATPLVWFFLDWLVLCVAIASLLVVDAWWVKVFASLVAALWIARLFVIGHDACHGAYTPNSLLNKWIGRIAFLPSLTPYSLWEVGHNLAHHGFT